MLPERRQWPEENREDETGWAKPIGKLTGDNGRHLLFFLYYIPMPIP
jgi:hypothetical protein